MQTTSFRDLSWISSTLPTHNFLCRLGVPANIADGLTSGLSRVSHPLEGVRRRRAADQCLARFSDAVDVPKSSAWARVAGERLPGLTAAVERCRQLFEAARDEPNDRWHDGRNKASFLRNVLVDADVCREPEIFSFATSDALLATACRYYDEVPRLTAVRLWWTPPNESAVSSQLWHRDTEAPEILKLFVNVTDVTPASGPLTFLPASASDTACARLRADERYVADERLAAVLDGGLGEAEQAVGPAGTALFVDTGRCMHYGSRGSAEDRVVLMLRFTAAHAPRVRAPRWAQAVNENNLAVDPLQQCVLGLS